MSFPKAGDFLASSVGNKLRIMYLKDILYKNTDEENQMSAADLIEALRAYGIEAERKSIYDDLEKLAYYGVDLIKTKSGWYVGSREFEISELKMLVDVIQSARFLTAKKSVALISKIEALAPKSLASKLRRSVVIAGRVKAPNESIYYNVDVIHDAIAQKKCISFKYFNYGEGFKKVYKREGEAYKVSPVSLMWDDENYYLVAWSEQNNALRHYRVDKMDKVVLTEEPASVRPEISEFDRAKYAKMNFNMFGGEETEVTLYIGKDSLGVFADRFGTDAMLIRDGDGFHATVKVVVSPHFYSWIFGLEGKIRIKAPGDVKSSYLSYCSSMLDKGVCD